MALPQITSVPALREWCVTVAVSKNAAVLGNYTIGQGDGITTNVMVNHTSQVLVIQSRHNSIVRGLALINQ